MKTKIVKISDGPGFKARAAVREAAAAVYGAEAQVLQIVRAGYRGDFWAWVARFEPQMNALRTADRKLKNLRRRAKRWEGKP